MPNILRKVDEKRSRKYILVSNLPHTETSYKESRERKRKAEMELDLEDILKSRQDVMLE